MLHWLAIDPHHLLDFVNTDNGSEAFNGVEISCSTVVACIVYHAVFQLENSDLDS